MFLTFQGKAHNCLPFLIQNSGWASHSYNPPGTSTSHRLDWFNRYEFAASFLLCRMRMSPKWFSCRKRVGCSRGERSFIGESQVLKAYLKLRLMLAGFKSHRKVLRLNTDRLPWSPLSAVWVPPANLPASGHLPMESLNLWLSAGGISQQLPHLSPCGRDRGIWIKITNEYRIHMPLVRAPELRVAQMQPK